jgi:hypothetical protein
MQEITVKPPKKAASPIFFGILSLIFAAASILLGILGLGGKIIELIVAFPAFFILGMFMMTFGIIIGIIIWIPVVNIIFTIILDLLFIFMAVCAVGAEALPFVLALASIVMGILAILKGISKDRYGALPMGMGGIVVSVVSSIIFIIPAIIASLVKIFINGAGIALFTKLLIEALMEAPLG